MLKAIGDLRGESYDDEFYESLSSPESASKFVKVDLPPTSPKAAQDAWNADKKTKLMRVDPEVQCLSVDGAIEKHDGGISLWRVLLSRQTVWVREPARLGPMTRKAAPRLNYRDLPI